MEILRLPVVIVEDPQKTIKYRCAECPFSTTKIFQLKKHKVDSAHSARGLTDTVKTATIEVDQATGATLDGTLSFTEISEVNTGDKGDKEDGFNNEKDKFEQPLGEIETNQKEDDHFSCDLCGKFFKSQNLLDSHVKIVHLKPARNQTKKKACPDCGGQFGEKYLYKHRRSVHSEQIVMCDQCDFQCNNRDSLRSHQVRKHAPKVMACDQCEAVFSNFRSRKSHIRDVHSAQQFYCEYCDHSTAVKASLDMHIKSRHTTTANFVCSFCPFETTDSDEIRSHREKEHPMDEKMKKATRVRTKRKVINYDCKVCGYKLNSKASRLCHMKSKHSNNTFPCGKCEYKSTTKVGLTKHMERIHLRLKFPCQHCSFEASSKAALRRHEIFLHQDLVKLYACDKCNYRARNKQLLQKHIISKDRRHD